LGEKRMAKAAAESLVGSTLGDKYAIEAFLGEGAMGSVYRAHQTSLHRTVAVKVLHRHLAEQPTFVERFQREAFSASLLDHPNSLRVLDFGQDGGSLYLVMEFVQGVDLLTVMERDWPLNDHRVVDILSQALAALATAHELGIVHRDLKPENILLLRGTDDEGNQVDVVKVCDFGIAKLNARTEKGHSFSRHLTTDGFVIGTPDYMSPEQARGEDIDGRSDIYSMGVVLYHLLVGRLPFTAETPLGVVLRHISDPPALPSSQAKVHPRLEDICMRALNKDPRDRYQSARDMRRALRMALTGDFEAATGSVRAPGGSTDMTSVPVSRRTPRADEASGLGRALRRLRLPITIGGKWAALGAAVAGFGGSLIAMRYLSTEADVRRAAVTTDDMVLTTPLPPIAESALAPVSGPPMTAEEPVRAKSSDLERTRASDRTKEGSDHPDRPRSERTVAHAAGAAAGEAPSSATAARLAAAQAPSAPAAEPAGASASPAPEIPKPSADPESRAPVPAAQTAKAAPAPPDPAAPSAPAPVDPARASVTVGAITTTNGISAGKVKVALARVPFTPCYRKALAGRPVAAPMESSLRIAVDMGGRVTGATLTTDGNLPGLRSCIESEARGLTIRDVDTGDGSAAVTLTFSPR
jgi:serine/threonine-protein kinase